MLQLLFLCLNSLHFRNQEEQESEGQSNMKTVMGEAHGAGFGFFLYTTLEHIPFNQYNFLLHSFLFSEDPKELNTTSSANPNAVQKEGKVTTRTCCFVLFGLFFSDQKCKLTKERN